MIVRLRDAAPSLSRFPGVRDVPLITGDTPSASVHMGVMTIEVGATLQHHIHTAEEAFYVLEGEGVVLVGEEEHPVEPETAILASAGVPHGFRNRGDVPLKVLFFYPVIYPKLRMPDDR